MTTDADTLEVSELALRDDEPPRDDGWILAYDPDLPEGYLSRPWVVATRCDGGFRDSEGYDVEPQRWARLPDPQPQRTGWRWPEGQIEIDEAWSKELNWRGWLVLIVRSDGTDDPGREPMMYGDEDAAVRQAEYIAAWSGLPVVRRPKGNIVPFMPTGARA